MRRARARAGRLSWQPFNILAGLGEFSMVLLSAVGEIRRVRLVAVVARDRLYQLAPAAFTRGRL